MFYIITVTVSVLIITLLNFLFDGVYSLGSFGGLLIATLIGVAAVFIIDALLAFVIRRLPERWFAPDARAFNVGKWERKLYRKTKINEWKKYVPEWGCFTGFHKDKLRKPDDSAYIGRFLLESNYGVAGHVAGAVFGFLIMLIPFIRPLTIALPVAAVNFVLSILPTLILRFNTPALRGLYKRNLEREKIK
jgi:glycosyl-4,4'-diaponeurosporenoate acyltransferase